MHCPACDRGHALDELTFRPPAAFGPWALVAAEVERGAWSPQLRAEAEARLGSLRVVARRS